MGGAVAPGVPPHGSEERFHRLQSQNGRGVHRSGVNSCEVVSAMPPDSWSRGHPSREVRAERLSRGPIAGIQNPQLRDTALTLIRVGGLSALMACSADTALQSVNRAQDALLMQAGSAIVLVMTAVLAAGSWRGKALAVRSSGHSGSYPTPVASSS